MSPLHARLLSRKDSRARTHSPEEEEERANSRPLEVQDTPFISSTQGYADGGSSPLQAGSDHETVIQFIYQGEGAWESEADSDTSTPDCKRGKHTEPCMPHQTSPPVSPTDRAERLLTQQAVREISQYGMQFKLPHWLKDRRPCNPSVLVLADTQLHNWPKDGLCHVIVKDWPVKRWAQAIKLGEIRINCSIIVLYLEGTQTWRDVPPSRMRYRLYAG